MDYYKLPHGMSPDELAGCRRSKHPLAHHRFVSRHGFPIGYSEQELSEGGVWAKWFGGIEAGTLAEPHEMLAAPMGDGYIVADG